MLRFDGHFLEIVTEGSA